MERPYYLVEPCPNCGQEDEPYKYKGARMGSTTWGHDYACCSEKCGMEFDPRAHDLQSALMELAAAKSRVKELRKSLAENPLKRK